MASSHALLGMLIVPLAWLVARSLLPHLGVEPSLLGQRRDYFRSSWRFSSSLVRSVPSSHYSSDLTDCGLHRSLLWRVRSCTEWPSSRCSVVAWACTASSWRRSSRWGFREPSCFCAGHRLIGRVFGNPFALDRAVVGEMLRFGGWTQVVGLASLVNRQTDAIVIGSWVGLRSAGHYRLGEQDCSTTRTMPLALLGPLLPAAAAFMPKAMRRRWRGQFCRRAVCWV